MRKTKALFIILLILIISCIPFGYTNAHSVKLDPESLISMPYMIIGGSGTITIKSSVTDYTLYFQAVQVDSSSYSQMEKIKTDGDTSLATLKEQYTALKTEADNLKETYDTASDAYTEGLKNSELTETEKNALQTAYETARTNYQNKVTEYKNKVTEYNNKVTEINSKITELTPMYVESNWIKTTDNKISVDTTTFSGEQPYAVWAKLVTSDGTYYDEDIYTMTGTKATEINVTGVNLDKSTLSLTEGDSYTLTATISPSDATNKSLTWESDNEKIATVSNGKVTGVSEGTATITVSTEDGDYSATCKVTVTEKTNTSNDDKGTTPTENADDTTVKTGKLPQTGVSYVIVFAIIIIGIIGFILYKRVKYLNF
jgi:uncharacterized protein YjdB